MAFFTDIWRSPWPNRLGKFKSTIHFAGILWLVATLPGCGDDGSVDTNDDAGTSSGSDVGGTTGSSTSSTSATTHGSAGTTITSSDTTATTSGDTATETDSGGDEDTQLPEARAWAIEDHNWVLVIEDDEFFILEHTQVSCLTSVIPGMPLSGPLEHLPLLVDLPDDFSPTETTDFSARFHHAPVSAQARYIEQLPESCRDGLTPDVFDPNYEPDPRLDFDIFWHWFEQNYAFMDLYGVDWANTREQFRGQVSPETSLDELEEMFRTMLRPLDDGHVSIIRWQGDDIGGEGLEQWTPEGPYAHMQRLKQKFDQQTEIEDFEEFVEQASARVQQIMLDTYLEDDIQMAADGRVQWTKLKSADNIGYIAIHQMEALSDSGLALTDIEAIEAIMEQVLTDLGQVEGLIIDVRNNTGGYDMVSLSIAGHFTEQRTRVFSKQNYNNGELSEKQDAFIEPRSGTVFAGPVAVLISDKSASAAEIFAMAMKQLPQVTAIGDASNGALSDTMVRRITTRLAITLSHQVYTNPAGVIPEGIGVLPDVEAPFMLAADRQAGIDGAMEAAINAIGEQL